VNVHRYSRHHHRGPGFRHRRFPNREEWLQKLEEYQKDLEQEVADVADLIRRLKDDKPTETKETSTV
jgi:hypothetical protein